MEVNWIELFAVLFGILLSIAVYCNTREVVWGWPLGIVSVILSAILFYDVRLYADWVLQVIYVVLGFYGWYVWLYGSSKQSALSVSRLSRNRLPTLLVMGGVGMLIIGYLFDRYTDAELVYWDAFTTSFSLVGQYLLARKKIENWLLWIVVDAVASGIYVYKELYLIALLYFLYLGLAVYGYRTWQKSL